MSITLKFRGTCSLCGCRLRGIYMASVRVNKHSLRTTSTGLWFLERRCPECGFETDSARHIWALDAESAQKVAAARRKRGWSGEPLPWPATG